MHVPRDLSTRLLEAAEQTPLIDLYEPLLPESQRNKTRHDLLSWFSTLARPELTTLGLSSAALALLDDTKRDPNERWTRFAALWPHVRTTGAGRTLLRFIWDQYGVQEITAHSWRDVSSHMWKAARPGFYRQVLHAPLANVQLVFADHPVETGTGCVSVQTMDLLLAPSTESDLKQIGPTHGLTAQRLTEILAAYVRSAAEQGIVALRVNSLPDPQEPAREQIEWALGRIFRAPSPRRRSLSSGIEGREPALHAHLVHALLAQVSEIGLPVQVHISSNQTIERLAAFAALYPQARFLALYNGRGDGLALVYAARTCPNLTLGLGDLWSIAPEQAVRWLRIWLHALPVSKLFAVSGGDTLVEAVAVRAAVAREHIAEMTAEMVVLGELDEPDALRVLRSIFSENARAYFAL